MRSVILVHAMVNGMGRKEPCELLAMRDGSEDDRVVYSRCSVIDAPIDLPDGDYTVLFGAYSVPARKEAGLWLPGDATAGPLLAEQSEQSGLHGQGDGAFAFLRAIRNRVA